MEGKVSYLIITAFHTKGYTFITINKAIKIKQASNIDQGLLRTDFVLYATCLVRHFKLFELVKIHSN